VVSIPRVDLCDFFTPSENMSKLSILLSSLTLGELPLPLTSVTFVSLLPFSFTFQNQSPFALNFNKLVARCFDYSEQLRSSQLHRDQWPISWWHH